MQLKYSEPQLLGILVHYLVNYSTYDTVILEINVVFYKCELCE